MHEFRWKYVHKHMYVINRMYISTPFELLLKFKYETWIFKPTPKGRQNMFLPVCIILLLTTLKKCFTQLSTKASHSILKK